LGSFAARERERGPRCVFGARNLGLGYALWFGLCAWSGYRIPPSTCVCEVGHTSGAVGIDWEESAWARLNLRPTHRCCRRHSLLVGPSNARDARPESGKPNDPRAASSVCTPVFHSSEFIFCVLARLQVLKSTIPKFQLCYGPSSPISSFSCSCSGLMTAPAPKRDGVDLFVNSAEAIQDLDRIVWCHWCRQNNICRQGLRPRRPQHRVWC
jgi:hypothetical protein